MHAVDSATPLISAAPDGTEWLVSHSQAAFDAGEQDFRAGHLGKAREEFDQALDQLLASGFDLDADPSLSDLYHHIVETVSADELEAFRDGDGFREQKATPAPIDEIAEDTDSPAGKLRSQSARARGRGSQLHRARSAAHRQRSRSGLPELFQDTAGKRDCGNRPAARGALSRDGASESCARKACRRI